MSARTCTTIDGFVSDHVGARFHARHFAYAMPSEELSIGVAVARFDADDMRALAQLLEAIRAFPPHDSIWDVSRVQTVVPEAFVELQEYFRAHFHDALSVKRVAVVAPPAGPLRAAAAGMFAFLDPPYEARAFGTAEDAFAWLGRDDVALLQEEVAALAERSFDDVVAGWLDGHLKGATVKACARDIGLSARTLQRRLRDRRTSFEAEANHARVRAAERLLESDASITSIAYDAGFSSPQRFANIYRTIKGESPSAARARRRVAPDDT